MYVKLVCTFPLDSITFIHLMNNIWKPDSETETKGYFCFPMMVLWHRVMAAEKVRGAAKAAAVHLMPARHWTVELPSCLKKVDQTVEVLRIILCGYLKILILPNALGYAYTHTRTHPIYIYISLGLKYILHIHVIFFLE